MKCSGIRCSVHNADSFHVAREIHKLHRRAIDDGKRKPVLVLNLASAVNPGGGVRNGARAQEEDLCRKSTLLMPLESEAAGDALGYQIEFMRESEISQRYGSQGPDRYILDPQNGKAVISDDTQMSLFTACGLLYGVTRMNMRGIGSRLGNYIRDAYQSWYLTQTKTFAEINSMDEL